MFDITPPFDVKALVFLAGIILLSFAFYHLSEGIKPARPWLRWAAGALWLFSACLGVVYLGIIPVLSAFILTFLLFFPLRLLFLVIIDAVQKDKKDVLNIEAEQFRQLDVDSQLSLLHRRVSYYKKARITLQTFRGLAFMAFIISLLVFGLLLQFLLALKPLDILVLLANLILFLLIWRISPRSGGIFYDLLGKYVFSLDILRLKEYYERQILEGFDEINSVEQGYHLASKKQIMNRLRL